ncbi:MAG: hypothetical protein M3Q97_00400, partial [Bacteroidota bacterium]|nr:hypothetical protein [Bacteroidota bacterium]
MKWLNYHDIATAIPEGQNYYHHVHNLHETPGNELVIYGSFKLNLEDDHTNYLLKTNSAGVLLSGWFYSKSGVTGVSAMDAQGNTYI